MRSYANWLRRRLPRIGPRWPNTWPRAGIAPAGPGGPSSSISSGKRPAPTSRSPEAWDAVWSRIAQALPGTAVPAAAGVHASRNGSGPRILVAPAPVTARPRGRFRRLGAIVLVGLAQAAAILVALGLAWQTPPRPDGPRTPKPAFADNSAPAVPVAIRVTSPVKVDVEIQEGRLMLIPASGASWVVADRAGAMIPGVGGLLRAEMAVARVVDLTPPEMNFSSDPGLVILNTIESIATPQVAAR